VIRALVLDFDGLIINTEEALVDAYEAVYRENGVAFNRAEFVRSAGGAEYDFDPWHPFGRTADREGLEAARTRINRELGRQLRPLPGVVELLDAAREAGLKLAVASNSSHGHVDGHLERLGLRDRFALTACRGDAPLPKPDPALYRLAIRQLGVRGPEAIALEDSGPGSLAAKRAGMWAVAIPNSVTQGHDFGHVDLKLSSLAEVTLAALTARFGG
jgi:HAD superfamily hydrolase (TIGR01509 family)